MEGHTVEDRCGRRLQEDEEARRDAMYDGRVEGGGDGRTINTDLRKKIDSRHPERCL